MAQTLQHDRAVETENEKAARRRPNVWIDHLASSLFFILLDFFIFFLLILPFDMSPILSFDMSPLLMVSPLCAAGPVVVGRLGESRR
jgi:hypothetical protein